MCPVCPLLKKSSHCLHVHNPGVKVPLSCPNPPHPPGHSSICVCVCVFTCVLTWGRRLSRSVVPPLPPGCWSSPSPLHCPSETSSPQARPPCFPPFSRLLRPPPLLSACSKVGSQPRRISSPSRSALPSVGRHFPPGLCQTWNHLLRDNNAYFVPLFY